MFGLNPIRVSCSIEPSVELKHRGANQVDSFQRWVNTNSLKQFSLDNPVFKIEICRVIKFCSPNEASGQL